MNRMTKLTLPQTATVQLAEIEGARSTRGRLIVAARPGLAMRVVNNENCRQLAGRPQVDIQTEREADLSAWQFSTNTPKLDLKISRVLPELSLHGDHHFHLASSRLSLNSRLQVQVKRSGVFKVQFTLPKDYEVEDVQAPKLSYWDVDSQAEFNLLTLFMNAKTMGSLPVQLRLVKIVAEIPTAPRVPHIALVDQSRHTGLLRLTIEKGFGLEINDRKNTAAPHRKEDGSQTIRLLQADWLLTLKRLTLKPTTELEFMQTMRFEDNLIKGMMNMDITVENAPLRKLKFSSPHPLHNLNIRGHNIARLVTIDKQHWELEFLSAQTGKMHYELTWQVPVKAQQISLSSVSLDEASRQLGYVVFYVPSNVAVDFTEAQGLKKVDFRELDSVRSPVDLAASRACFRAFSKKPQIQAQLDKKDLAISLPAEIKEVSILTQVGVDASQISQVIIQMDPGTKSFLKTTLPPLSRLMNVIIDGNAVRPVLRDQEILIPLKGRPNGTQANQISLKILYITEPNSGQSFEAFQGPAFDLPLNQIRWNIFMPEHGNYKGFAGNMKYIEGYSAAKMVSSADIIQQNTFSSRSSYKGKMAIEEGLQLSQQGRNIEARMQLEQAVEESLGDKGMQEDARVQLNKLWRTQAQMAITNRRTNLGLTGRDQKFNKNYTVSDVKKTMQGLQETDSSAMGHIGEKIFARQRAARKRVQPLRVTLPEHGKHLEFYRQIMVEKNIPLEIAMQASFETKTPQKQSPILKFIIMSLCVISGLMMLGLRAKA